VTFVHAITRLSARFLTERSFELIVAPALADLQYDDATGRTAAVTRYVPVLAAFAGGLWDDAVRGGDFGTFAGLVLIPVCYYTFFFLLGLPEGMGHVSSGLIATLAIMVVMLSLAPVIVCYWPERVPDDPSPEQQ
jgi:hypothetical protein